MGPANQATLRLAAAQGLVVNASTEARSSAAALRRQRRGAAERVRPARLASSTWLRHGPLPIGPVRGPRLADGRHRAGSCRSCAPVPSLATELDRPRALWVISPYWETRLPTVGTTEAVAGHRLETVHDFGGFDPCLYEIQYPASRSPQAAQEVVEALQAAGLPVVTDPRPGWTTALGCHFATSSPRWMCRCCPSRSSTTAAPVMAIDTIDARRFSDWIAQQLEAGNTEALLDYRQQHPDAVQTQGCLKVFPSGQASRLRRRQASRQPSQNRLRIQPNPRLSSSAAKLSGSPGGGVDSADRVDP
ncbi:MAG: hypothetical protein ACK5N0_09205 [Synechococcaceae cyanobacterium]